MQLTTKQIDRILSSPSVIVRNAEGKFVFDDLGKPVLGKLILHKGEHHYILDGGSGNGDDHGRL
jgi:hypothetical protein